MIYFDVECREVVVMERARRGWNQSDLALRAGVSRPVVSQIENGRASESSMQSILAILSTLGHALTIESIGP